MENKIYFVGNAELVKSDLYELSIMDNCIKWLNSIDEVDLDTETEGMFNHNNKIVMLQLHNEGITYVVDTRYNDLKGLKKLETMLVNGQNLKFDYKFLKFHGITLNNIYDTFLAECVLTTGKENRELGLGALAQKYCGITLDKSVRNQFVGLDGAPFTEQQIVYGVGDVTCLREIKHKQLIKAKDLNLENVIDLENKACVALADIEYNGFKLDVNKWKELALKAESNVYTYEKELDEMVRQEPKLSKYVLNKVQGNLFAGFEEGFEHSRDINIKWSSPTQIFKVLQDLGLKIDSTNEKEITKYQNKFPLVKKFIDFKKHQKLVTTYGMEFLKYVNKHTGKVHTSFFQILETGRISSGSKHDRTPNMQNIPANNDYRNCFIPDNGNKIVSCDYSGQELRVVTYVSQEPVWIEAFKNNKDLHSEVAAMVFDVPIDKVKDKPDFLRGKSYRDVAKTVNFALIYGASAFKMSLTLNIPKDEAQALIDKYFSKLPKLQQFLDTASKYGKQNLMIRTCKPYSRIRFFENPNGDFVKLGEIERASKNTVVQGTSADMTKLALHYIREYINKNNLNNKVKMVMTVHDQIDCEVISSYAEEWSLIQKKLMEDAGSVIIKGIPVISEITISDCWSK